MSLDGKKVLVGLTGGIACYKVPYLVRALGKQGVEVRVMMTESATKLITPLTMETVSRHQVYTSMFSEREFVGTRHIDLANWGDLVVIAPATANFLGKIASGISDDLLTTVVCASTKPVMIAPAMNPGMWHNPITQRNYSTLKEFGYRFVGPAEGEMAERQFGMGRMVEPAELFDAVKAFFEDDSKKKLLSGRKILVTAGPCREPIDPVRYISNRSSGKMGYAIAEAAVELGAEVTLVSGPTSLSAPTRVKMVPVERTAEMRDAVVREFGNCDCLVMAAAPSDFTPAHQADQKLKRTDQNLQITLEPTADILKGIAGKKRQGQIVVGFAVETQNDEANARRKLSDKHLDLIVLNNPTVAGAAFDHDTNQVILIAPDERPESWPLMSKREVAGKLLARIADLFRTTVTSSKKA
jgi:phosphopantothenoylcysteine decarboxylase / phosphopantothenate---cysteine ligase